MWTAAIFLHSLRTVLTYEGEKMKLSVLVLGFAVSLSVTALAQTPTDVKLPTAPSCISKSDMTEIASDFKQFSDLAGNEYCHDGSETANLLATLMFMRKNQFSAGMKPSQDELFSGKFAESWYTYFTDRIDNMEVDSGCPKGVAAYVYGFGGSTMYVCTAALNDNFSALDRASIFMHEARHIDGYPHMTCTKGARKGLQGACDTRISAGGSYAVTVETYAQLAKYGVELHPALRAYARASAVIYADETFETPAKVNREAQLMVLTKDKDLHAISLATRTRNALNKIEALGQASALGRIVMRAQHMILLPEDKTLPAKFMFTKNVGEINQSPGDAFTEYNAQTPAQRSELVDFHSGAQWNAKVYKKNIKFSCDPRATTTSELAFNGPQAVTILHVNGYDRVARTQYVLTTAGELYEFGCTEQLTSFLRPSSQKVDQEYSRIHKVGPSLIGLTTDGKLRKLTGTTSTALSTALDGQIFEIAPREVLSFFDSAK